MNPPSPPTPARATGPARPLAALVAALALIVPVALIAFIVLAAPTAAATVRPEPNRPRDHGGERAADRAESATRAAALAFAAEVRAGNLKAAREVSFGSAMGYEQVELLSRAWVAVDKVRAALRAHLGPEGARLAERDFAEDFPEHLDADAANATLTLDGDTATLAGPGFDGEADTDLVVLRRVAGRWKVDVDATLKPRHVPETALFLLELAHLGPLADQINAGKITNMDELKEAYDRQIEEVHRLLGPRARPAAASRPAAPAARN